MKQKIIFNVVLFYMSIAQAGAMLTRGEPIFKTWDGTYAAAAAAAIPYREPTIIWGDHKNTIPLPTNRWYTTLTVNYKPGTNDAFPVSTFPYMFNLTDTHVEICCPNQLLTPDQNHIINVFLNNLQFSSLETLQGGRRIISPVLDNPLSVTVQWGNNERNIVMPIVRGMPYVTFECKNITPSITTQNAILNVNDKGSSGLETSSQFFIQMNNGQTWFLFTSSPITLNWTGSSLTASSTFNGVLRLIQYAMPVSSNIAVTKFPNSSSISPTASGVSGAALTKNITPPLPPNPSDPAWQSKLKSVDDFKKRFEQFDLPAIKIWYKDTYGKDFPYDVTLTGNTPQQMYNNYVSKYYNPILSAWKSQGSKVLGRLGLSSAKNSMQSVAEVLKKYSTAYPVGARVETLVKDKKTNIKITWDTKGSGPLLMMSLPHHRDILQNPIYDKDITFNSIRGLMRGVVAREWNLQDEAPDVGWYAGSIPDDKINDIKQALAQDISITPLSSDSYGFGKELAKMARLALIAKQLNDDSSVQKVLNNMKVALTPWLNQTNPDALKYDNVWGGICTINGLHDSGADFGMGWYNDHHFHFGYFIYAAAVYIQLATSNDTFIQKLKPFIIDLIRDIASPKSDEYFPDHRLMDWYLGYSLASGVFPFADGKNQESTSEAVNAWYGIYLFGLATNDKEIQNLGLILLATEIRGAQTYWHMTPKSEIYPADFAKNTCVGIVWETKVDYATWFGANVEFIHLIQFLPFTPITAHLITPAWNTYQYNLLQTALTRPSPALAEGWKGYLYMSQAISDPNAAWNNVKSLTSYDNGNTKTNTLYWVATRNMPDKTDLNKYTSGSQGSTQSSPVSGAPTDHIISSTTISPILPASVTPSEKTTQVECPPITVLEALKNSDIARDLKQSLEVLFRALGFN